jgi:predicted enzyme related to lactoylglutathione lyase
VADDGPILDQAAPVRVSGDPSAEGGAAGASGRSDFTLWGCRAQGLPWEAPAFRRGSSHGYVKTGGEGSINGGIYGVKEGVCPHVTFYVMVDDLQAALSKAESLGGKTVMGPTPIPGAGMIAMFQDLDGNCIGLYKEN